MASVGFQLPEKTSSVNFACASFPPSIDYDDDYEDDLGMRIEEFKQQNPLDVEELKRCIQEVLNEAERQAQEKLDAKAREEEEARERNLNAFMTGLKDKNKRVVTRARSLARSLFDTICNCTNNVSNPIQQAATRLRRQQTAFERVESSERTERSSSVPRQQTRFAEEI